MNLLTFSYRILSLGRALVMQYTHVMHDSCHNAFVHSFGAALQICFAKKTERVLVLNDYPVVQRTDHYLLSRTNNAAINYT